jgi:hypothetical protein
MKKTARRSSKISSARQLIEQTVEAELAALLEAYKHETTEEGLARLVRHGYLPESEVMTGVGPVKVQVPRMRDRGEAVEKIRFPADDVGTSQMAEIIEGIAFKDGIKQIQNAAA